MSTGPLARASPKRFTALGTSGQVLRFGGDEVGLEPELGAQWVINGYLLALAALFALGGKLGDVLGRRRMVVIGVIGFAIASACCGFTPKGSTAQAWIIAFRVLQARAPRCCSRRLALWWPHIRCVNAGGRWRRSSGSRAA